MPKLETLTEKYIKLCEEIKKFEVKNKSIMEPYQMMMEAKEALTDQIKMNVRESGQGLENTQIKVNAIPVWKKIFSYSKFIKVANKKEVTALVDNDGLEIKKDVFEKLAADGVIKIDTVQASYSEAQGTTRVDIKLKGK